MKTKLTFLTFLAAMTLSACSGDVKQNEDGVSRYSLLRRTDLLLSALK